MRLLDAADSAVLVELDGDDDELSAAVLALDARVCASPPAGVVETVPALRTLLVEYDPLRTSHARLVHDLEALAEMPAVSPAPRAGREHTLPTRYGGGDGPDLGAVARATGLTTDGVVRLHAGATYRVAMLGNQPGLPYLIGLDPRLAVPRRDDPRAALAAGSVAVAERLSCVYPFAGPGGWNIVGRTDAVLFDPARTPPALLAPGDVVRFLPVDSLGAARSRSGDGNAHDEAGGGTVLLVIEPGLLTTVQDGGRHGLQRSGVPVSGALDREWLHVANLLVGNAPDAAALEVTHSGPTLEARAPSTRLAVAGDCTVTRVGRDGSEHEVGPWRSVVLREGERLRVGRMRDSLRGIVAVEGGVGVPELMGSRSTCVRGGFGGHGGRALRGGDALPLLRSYAGHHPDVRLDPDVVGELGINTGTPCRLRAVPGPQHDRLDDAGRAALLDGAATFTVSHRSDRTGVRLDGTRLRRRDSAEMASEGCAPGSVQVPGGGQPIVLLADRGTTGGYPKAATVASVDLPLLARLRPGAQVRFAAVDVAGAEALRRERERRLAQLSDHLTPVPPL